LLSLLERRRFWLYLSRYAYVKLVLQDISCGSAETAAET
jgi:hypothetical protein